MRGEEVSTQRRGYSACKQTKVLPRLLSPACPALPASLQLTAAVPAARVSDGKPRLVKEAAGVEENRKTEPEGAEATRSGAGRSGGSG